MNLSPEMILVLKIGSGLFWTLTYLSLILRGFKDRTYGMPIAAAAANIAWEFIFSFIKPHTQPQVYINIVWFLFDVVIVAQILMYGRRVLSPDVVRRWFYPLVALTFVCGFVGVYGVCLEFNDWDGKYAAFGQNLMMSILFVALLIRRDSLDGQSLYMAIFKMIGTVMPSIIFYAANPGSLLMGFFYVAIFVFDWIYIVLVYRKCHDLGLDPWRRF